MDSSDNATPPRPSISTLEQARHYPNAFLYLDCENEIPITSPISHVNCTDEALQRLCDDLGIYGLLTDATNCIYFDLLPSDLGWSEEQLKGQIWVAPMYEKVLGPAIRRLFSGAVRDIYNDQFDATAQLFLKLNDDLGTSSLYRAASRGSEETIERMIRLSPNLNCRNSDGDTPLHGAVTGRHKSVVERLLHCGADVNSVGARGRTPLHVAIYNVWAYGSDAQIPNLLIHLNADVNRLDEHGFSPLDYLDRWCPENRELREILLAHGARAGRKTTAG